MTRAGASARFGASVGDQVLSSLTNFGLGVVVARSVSPRDFGAFSLAVAAYLLALGASRALNTDVLLVRFSDAGEASWREAASRATGAALAFGAVVGLALAAGGAAVGGAGGATFVVVGSLLGGLLVQDAWRMAFVAHGRPAKALVNDLLWAVLLFPLLLVLARDGRVAASTAALAWAASATAAAVFGFLQARGVRLQVDPRPWWRAHRTLSVSYLGEFLVTGGASQLVLYAIGLLAGLEAVGALRAALLLLGPFLILLQGGSLFGVAEGARRLRLSVGASRRVAVGLSLGLLVSALAWSAVVLLVPMRLGTTLLGAAWREGRAAFPPIAMYAIASALAVGPTSGLRALAAARRSLQIGLTSAPLMLLGGSVGAVVDGGRGAAAGMALANGVGCALRWWHYGRALDDHRHAAAAAPSPVLDAGDV